MQTMMAYFATARERDTAFQAALEAEIKMTGIGELNLIVQGRVSDSTRLVIIFPVTNGMEPVFFTDHGAMGCLAI